MTWPQAVVAINAIWAVVVLLSVWIWSSTYVKGDLFDDFPEGKNKKETDDLDLDWG